MLSWLFGFNYLYDLLIVVVICATIVLCVKSEGFREILKLIGKYVGLPLCAIVLIGSAVYSCIHLNMYYTAQGGIYGQLSQIFGQNNQVNVEVDEKIFSFKDVILTQADGDIYSAKMISEKVIKLKSDESYAIYVNNTPCTYSETSPDHFKALYTYNFYNKEDVCEKTDTLELYFQLNNKGIEIEVQTRGGSSAVRYWNNYFNKNGFEVKISKTEKQNSGDINIGEGDISNYVIATFHTNDGDIKGIYQPADRVEFPILQDTRFLGWALTSEGQQLLVNYEIKEDTDFYAVYRESYQYTLTFYLDDLTTIHSQQVVSEGDLFIMPEIPQKEGYEFLYWVDSNDKVIGSPYQIKGDTSLYAVFTEAFFNIKIVFDKNEVGGRFGSVGGGIDTMPDNLGYVESVTEDEINIKAKFNQNVDIAVNLEFPTTINFDNNFTHSNYSQHIQGFSAGGTFYFIFKVVDNVTLYLSTY